MPKPTWRVVLWKRSVPRIGITPGGDYYEVAEVKNSLTPGASLNSSEVQELIDSKCEVVIRQWPGE